MANYNDLKTAIQQVVKTNGNNEITGALLQQSLLAMINSLGAGFQFMGVATPTTNPGTPDQRIFYIAGPGVYPNFGITIEESQIGILRFDEQWLVGYLQFTIADDSVTNEKIADNAVTKSKLSLALQNEIIHPVDVTNAPNDVDLDISDEHGFVLARFQDGHFKIDKFDTRDAATKDDITELEAKIPTPEQLIHPVETDNISNDIDLDISDENGNAIVRFQNGHIQTEKFNSEDINIEHPVNVEESENNADLEIADESGNVILRLEDGHIQTEKFNSQISETIGYKII